MLFLKIGKDAALIGNLPVEENITVLIDAGDLNTCALHAVLHGNPMSGLKI